MTFEDAKRRYVHRFTMEHVPDWAKVARDDGTFYAPAYRSDQEWFDNTLFPPRNPFSRTDCYSSDATWPIGKSLTKVYDIQFFKLYEALTKTK